MKIMTDNELQMVFAQVSIAGLIGAVDCALRCTMLKAKISPAPIYKLGTAIVTPLLNIKLMKALMPVLAILVNFQIPQDLIKTVSTIN